MSRERRKFSPAIQARVAIDIVTAAANVYLNAISILHPKRHKCCHDRYPIFRTTSAGTPSSQSSPISS